MSFQSIAHTIDQWIADDIVPAASIAIMHRGTLVASHAAGFAQPGQPADDQTMFALASVSKPITAAAIMHAIDAGHLHLDDAVGSIVPEFGMVDPLDPDLSAHLEEFRDEITLRQVLCHTSGLPELLSSARSNVLERPTLDQQVDVMMTVPLKSEPGERLRYSNIGPAIAARAMEMACGVRFHEYAQKHVLDPLGLTNIAITPAPDRDHQIAIVADPANPGTDAESYNTRWWRDNGVTWGGYFGSAIDIAAFAQTFLADVSPILSRESVVAMTTDQTGGAPGGVESMGATWNPGAWAIGWEVKGDKRRHWTGTRTSPRTFCHFGQAGTLAWADPERELVAAVFGARTVRNLWPLRPARWSELSDAIVEEADHAV